MQKDVQYWVDRAADGYIQWARGDVYQHIIYKNCQCCHHKSEIKDSCSGYIGDMSYAIEAAKEWIDAF